MAQIFVSGAARDSFDGLCLIAQDAASVGTVYGFEHEVVSLSRTTNNSYQGIVDGSALRHTKTKGVSMGALSISGLWTPDRAGAALVTQAFGPRTYPYKPYFLNLVPYNGGTSINATGLFPTRLTLSGRFGTRGDDAAVRYTMQFMVLDVNNTLTAPTLTSPGYIGTAGLGPTSFADVIFTDGQGSPVTYDEVTAFSLMLDNNMGLQRSMKDAVNRIANGCTPGYIDGALSLSQLNSPTQALPSTDGTFPFAIKLPTGDLSHYDTLSVSASWDNNAGRFSAEDFITYANNYTLFSTSAGATTSGAWSFTWAYT